MPIYPKNGSIINYQAECLSQARDMTGEQLEVKLAELEQEYAELLQNEKRLTFEILQEQNGDKLHCLVLSQSDLSSLKLLISANMQAIKQVQAENQGMGLPL